MNEDLMLYMQDPDTRALYMQQQTHTNNMRVEQYGSFVSIIDKMEESDENRLHAYAQISRKQLRKRK